MMNKRLLMIWLILLLPATGLSQPLVAVTIRPLQFIAAAILDGVAEPVPVMRANANPHHYAMRPSERRAMASADLLLWIGPSLESHLAGIEQNLKAEILTAENLEGVRRLSLGTGLDPHLWLDFDNAERIAQSLTQALSELDPVNAAQYANNLAVFRDDLSTSRLAISKRIEAADRSSAYAVYHNAFRYFEAQFNISPVVSFTSNEELGPGVRRLLEIKAILEANAVDCILVEPGTNIPQLNAVIDNENMRYISLDVMGSELAVTAQSFTNLMQTVSDGLLTCLE